MHLLLRVVRGGANDVMCDVPDKAEELKCTHSSHTASWREAAPLVIQRKQLNGFLCASCPLGSSSTVLSSNPALGGSQEF